MFRPYTEREGGGGSNRSEPTLKGVVIIKTLKGVVILRTCTEKDLH